VYESRGLPVQLLFRQNRISKVTLYSPMVTICTTSFDIQQFCVLPTIHLCVLCRSHEKQRLFLYTALTDFFYNRDGVCLLRGTDWVFKSDRYSFVIKGLKTVFFCYQKHLKLLSVDSCIRPNADVTAVLLSLAGPFKYKTTLSQCATWNIGLLTFGV
jgi:hypothetical protein